MNWYAVMCGPQKESDAERYLQRVGFRTFFPHVTEWVGLKGGRARLFRRAWFSRYLFVETERDRLHLIVADEGKICGVSCVVAPPKHEPLPLPLKFVTKLMGKADPLGQIHRTEPSQPSSAFPGSEGDKIKIMEGHALWNFLAEVKRVAGNELFIELDRPMLGSKYARIPARFAELLKAG